MNKVFVYGTLKRGFPNHHLICEGKFLGIDFIYGKLLDLGSFPAVVEGKRAIEGEIFEVDENLIKRLDYLEGHPSFYQRKQTQTINSGEQVFYYEFQKIALKAREITSGRWT